MIRSSGGIPVELGGASGSTTYRSKFGAFPGIGDASRFEAKITRRESCRNAGAKLAFPFFVTANNTYLLETLSAAFTTGTADDTFISVYRNTFNPAAALTNVVAADDDAGPGHLSTLSTALLAGTQYFLVVTSFANAQFGPYTGHLNSTTALGQVVLGAVPELPTSVLMLTPLVIGGLVAARRRRAS